MNNNENKCCICNSYIEKGELSYPCNMTNNKEEPMCLKCYFKLCQGTNENFYKIYVV